MSAATVSEFSKFKRVKTEIGESYSSGKRCMICMENKPTNEMFGNISYCSHFFCVLCISKYVANKIQENIGVIKCPDIACQGIIEPQFWREIVPKEGFDRWESDLCESLILGSQKIYCPYKDCAAMLVDDGSENIVTECECPNCRRLFRAQCNVSWHVGYYHKEFHRLGRNEKGKELDVMLMELAKNKKWRRCPKCKIYVEKLDGCLRINCRCGHDFCYGCGLDHSSRHVCPRI
ncbi:PREDICTED: E3 ubiquitin-protein ligase RNF144A-like [Nicotiana attenuata]|uniref:E3 ubiquitin-protein ligase RNF144A-like n=1 Tax=Nicotiana attenuata TaxID=49451 RepID=UPI000904C40E|nr:PREDICTED: E3 ubiquitin-protein ligase RNF144A-like [Nicotiana attenuata]